MAMGAKEAERLARVHVGAEAELVYCAEPPPGLYLPRPDPVGPGAEFLFLVIRTHPMMVGGSDIIAVDRETGVVRLAGNSGE